MRVAWIVSSGLAILVAGCAAIPRVELTAYTAAYADIQTVTNGVLDIVAPYERVVIRFAARSAASISSGAPMEAFAQAGSGVPGSAQPTPKPDPGLLAPKPDPSLLAKKPRPPARPDPSLLARPARPTPGIDPSLLAGSGAPRPVASRVGALVSDRPCRGFGTDPYCYEMRDGYADIGDPPLVAAYRNLSNVILRFNMLLVAYSDGISGRLLRQELEGFSSSINQISKLAPITNISGAGTFAASFTGIVNSLLPIADLAGGVIDRSQLRIFLLDNYEIVDQAILLMAQNSSRLYANVYVGTQLFQIKTRGAGENLNTRRREIRRLIANWTVLLDDTRRVLRELKIAIEASDGLETRIRNLEATVTTRIDTTAIKKQIATLGTPTLPP